MADATQYCTFWVDTLYLGIDVHSVQEVMRTLEMTPVPLASASVVGLINLRGQIVTAIDLRRRLGLPPRPDDQEPMNVVMRTDDGAVSLVVDEIGDVIEVSNDTFERVPDTMQGEHRALIRGVYKLNKQLLLILDGAKTALPELSYAAN
ncbi:chemotaxis protein CheW [Gemmatimonas groenlandica]|uniref:Chemotaxis protein CheW n=1 Tax=Gemmatimonas groenlandica TaxID=2732249 RepID=A0A6M4IUG2_9BACT|nr:chemotaxis protein CheW [Gemmatimonas groenlandica]QJR36462.1 chemotaxis protein CheW [Gemmatimonas groenlandica]